jgi:hypothetical protein
LGLAISRGFVEALDGTIGLLPAARCASDRADCAPWGPGCGAIAAGAAWQARASWCAGRA